MCYETAPDPWIESILTSLKRQPGLQPASSLQPTSPTSRGSRHAFSFLCFIIMNVHQYKGHNKLKSSFTYIVIYSFTIWTQFDKWTQYMMNCIHLNTASFY